MTVEYIKVLKVRYESKVITGEGGGGGGRGEKIFCSTKSANILG